MMRVAPKVAELVCKAEVSPICILLKLLHDKALQGTLFSDFETHGLGFRLSPKFSDFIRKGIRN